MRDTYILDMVSLFTGALVLFRNLTVAEVFWGFPSSGNACFTHAQDPRDIPVFVVICFCLVFLRAVMIREKKNKDSYG